MASSDGALRADAALNRDRLVAAAREVFAEEGLAAPLEEIARRAGVGIATLYRRFPSRDDLIAASFEDKLADYAAAIDEALSALDAWSAFSRYVERVCAMQAEDRGLRDVLTLTFPTAKRLERARSRSYRRFAELIRRAKAEGTLRKDFVSQDLVLTLMANAGVVNATRDAAPDAWKRFVGFMLEAFRADRARPLVKPPSPRQMQRAMRRVARR
jgi:AcrR family transcriptional regulator